MIPSRAWRTSPLIPFQLVLGWDLEVSLSFVGTRAVTLRSAPNTISPSGGRRDYVGRPIARWRGEWCVIAGTRAVNINTQRIPVAAPETQP